MALQNFVDRVGPVISAAFLNGVDVIKTTILADAATKAQARAALVSDAVWTIAQGGTGQVTAAAAIAALLSQSAYNQYLADSDPFKITAAETAAGLVAANINFDYPSHEVIGIILPERYGAVGNWNGTTGTDDSTAFRRVASVLTQLGGGAALFSKRYRVFSDGSTTPLFALSALRGTVFYSSGAEFVVDRTFTGSQTVRIGQFTACIGINFVGTFKLTCTQIQPVNEKATRGPEFATFLQGCFDITSQSINATGFRLIWHVERAAADPESYISKGFDLGVTYSTDGGYAYDDQTSGGWGVKATLVTNRITRSYFTQGGIGHKILVISKDHEASVDCLIANTGTKGGQNIELTYINRESTFADSSRVAVRVEAQDSELFTVVFRNIDINVDIVNSSGAVYMGGVQLSKMKSDNTADATGRLHVFENIRISGTIKAASSNQTALAICATGTWSTENVDTISFENLRCDGTAQPNINLIALKRTATFSNCYFSSNPNIVGNTTSQITMVNCESDSEFTTTTGDTSLVIYIGCTFGAVTNQSKIGKLFYGCSGLGSSYTANLTGTSGADPTGTISYTIDGNLVTLHSANIQGTSDAAGTLLQGMPAIIRPASAQIILARVQDNTLDGIAIVRVETNGDITLFRDVAGNAMTALGTKGLSSQTLPPYRLV